MTDAAQPTPPLIDDLRSVIAGLEHARRSLGGGNLADADVLWPRLERCARRVVALDQGERDGIKSVMVALLDELERTIAAFGAEHRQIGERLRSASRNIAAGTAYHQAKTR